MIYEERNFRSFFRREFFFLKKNMKILPSLSLSLSLPSPPSPSLYFSLFYLYLYGFSKYC